MRAAKFATKGPVATEVALGCFDFRSFLYFETGPVLLFCVSSVGGRDGDDGIVEVGFKCENIVGCVCYPAVVHTALRDGGVGWLVSRADCEDGHVVDAD